MSKLIDLSKEELVIKYDEIADIYEGLLQKRANLNDKINKLKKEFDYLKKKKIKLNNN